MSVKLIAENILDADDFYSATEQEGERWGQPEPASDNEGSLRPIVSGTPANFTYSGTATGDGAGGGTTVIDSVLAAFGDDYFIGATVAITSGACDGESKTVTDFAQATGTLTTSAFSAQIVTGVTFTLTLPFTNRDFRVELIAAGDAGDATFKWSHNGGTTYLGRDDPNQADWPGPFQIIADASNTNPIILQCDDDALLFVYRNIAGGGSVLAYTTSSDRGMTWSAATTISSTYPYLHGIEKLSSGRILVLASNIGGDHVLIYSDDDGSSWSDEIPITLGVPNSRSMIRQLANGNLIIVYENTDTVECKTSSDGGFNWSTAVVIANDAEAQEQPTVIQAENGDIICAYVSDEDSAGDQEIKCKVSTDGGATWGSAIAVINFTSDLTYPTLFRDLNYRLYCLAQRAPGGGYQIDMTYSDDNGATWSTGSVVTIVDFDAGGPGYTGGVNLIDGHLAMLAFCNSNDDVAYFHVRGYWEAYSANACVCAPEALAQHLACGAEVTWYGGAGIAGDDWSFEPEYDFAMENLIEDSPSRPWRSEQDNIECNIVLKPTAGAFGTHKIYADSIALFGCNLRTLDIEMCNDGNFTDGVDETVSFDLGTGTVEYAEVDDETGASWGEAYHGLSLADGQAFIRVEGVDLSDYAGGGLFNFQHYCIVVHDSAAKKAKGYIADADAAQALGAELLSNEGFETAGAGGADVWANWVEDAQGGTFTNEAVIVHGGADAMKNEWNGVGTRSQLTQSISVTAGALYKVEFWTRGDGTKAGRWDLYDIDNSGYILTIQSTGITGTDYTAVTRYFVAPVGCSNVQIDFYSASGGGTFYLDDVSIKEVTDDGTDGVHIMDTEDGTDQNWYDIEAGFDYNDDAYTFEVYVTPHNEVGAATFLAGYKDHELKGKYLRFTSGGQSGNTYEILDNVDDQILLDTDDALLGVFDGDAFAVFGKEVAFTFTGGPYRCVRLSIGAQQTAENYYQIGSMVLGRAVTLEDPFSIEYEKNIEYGVTLLDTPAGSLIPVVNFDRKRRFTLRFVASDAGRKQVVALLDYIAGKNITLILDSTDLTDCHLVKLKSVVEQEHVVGDCFSFEAEFEEVI